MLTIALSVINVMLMIKRLAYDHVHGKIRVQLAPLGMSVFVSKFVLSSPTWSLGWNLRLNCISS